MKKDMNAHDRNTFDDSYDESEDFDGSGLSEPKRSPMRRKEKFRTKDFQAHKKPKDRRRSYRSKMDYDLLF